DDSRNELDDQIDDRLHGARLSLAVRCAVPTGRRHPRLSTSLEIFRNDLVADSEAGLGIGFNGSLWRARRYSAQTRCVPPAKCLSAKPAILTAAEHAPAFALERSSDLHLSRAIRDSPETR